MSNNIMEIYQIDEFSEIARVPKTSITKEIIEKIRNLRENNMERFIREILYDPNETPHGPTEIADILSNVRIRGRKSVTAFVLKGRSKKRIRSKDVAHQFMKLRQIPNLDLIIFGAVGEIQDDAQRDLIQTANDAKCKFLIINANEWARLFIAYGKICPKDGLPFSEDTGICENGHELDVGLTIETKIKEDRLWFIHQLKDVSTGVSKRYRTIVFINRYFSKETIKNIIFEVIEDVKKREYYRNPMSKRIWEKKPAQVIWIFFASDTEDIKMVNWICRTKWVDPKLPKQFQPILLSKNSDIIGEIEIAWNDKYKESRKHYSMFIGTKEEVLNKCNSIMKKIKTFTIRAIQIFEEYNDGRFNEDQMLQKIREFEPEVHKLYLDSADIPIPPDDILDYVEECHSLFAHAHNLFLYCSDRRKKPRNQKNRDWLMKDTIISIKKTLETISYEKQKLI